MRHIFSDVRFALRLMRRSPGFFGTLLAIIACGIGATTAMFSIVESLLLRPLQYPHPEELTMIWRSDPQVPRGPTSIPDFLDYKAQGTTFERMSATDYASLSLSSPGAKPEPLQSARVSGDFFSMLGIQPLRGRFLTPEDDRLGGPRVAVVSAALWHRRFGSDPDLVGRAITLSGEPFTVVGIAPEGFSFSGPYTDRTDVWTPLAASYPGYADDSKERGNHFLHVMGRRKPGVSLGEAQAQLAAIAKNLELAYPDENAKIGVFLEDLHDMLVGSSRSGVWILFAAVALVFVIVCANVSNLLLTRAQSRHAEMAARAALGATPSRLAAQLVTETVVVFLLGAIGSALASRELVDLFASGIIEGDAARTIPVHLDVAALLFSVVTCLACGLVFGLVPALAAARVEPQAVLKETAARAGTSRSQRTVRSALVVAQVAFAFALLVGSGLALKAFASVAARPIGFDPTNVASARVVLPEAKYANGKAALFYRDLIAKIRERPDVEAAGANNSLPMSGSNSSGSFKIEGRAPWAPGEGPNLERNIVTPGYFKAMGIPILRGRDFTEADTRDGRLVMIISQSAADRFFPGEDPIGHRIDWEDVNDEKHPLWREIVGVVGDVRRRGLERPVAVESFLPLAQHGNTWMAIVARTPHPEALLQDLPAIVASIDPDQAVTNRRKMTDRVADSIGHRRYVALLLTAFAGAALLLATLGIFGLISYATTQRTRELGIRIALGSTPEGIVGLVMKSGLRLVALGLALGLGCAVLVGRALASRIAEVATFDLSLCAAIAAVLGAAGLLACLVPALRAVRIPPAIALRYE